MSPPVIEGVPAHPAVLGKTPHMSMEKAAASCERQAATLAFSGHFMLMGSYYILRPVRDTMATVIGVGHLQQLFTATFLGTLLGSFLYNACASRLRLSRLLAGVFWFWLLNILVFASLYRLAPSSLWLAAAYYLWFSVANLFMISVFWSLTVDVFSPSQAARWFAFIAAGGSLGAIVGPLFTRTLAAPLGLSGLLAVAAAGFAVVIVLVHWLMRAKARLREVSPQAQQSTFDETLKGPLFGGLRELLRSRYVLHQGAFMLLMTWVNTVAYFCQTELVAQTYPALADRARAIADIDLAVNIGTAAILLVGARGFLRRFGVTAALVCNPVLMVAAFLATALSPTLWMVQLLQILRRVAQYAVARPSREICFTVLDQGSRYKAKNTIDTVVYRAGDLGSAWLQTGLRAVGYGMGGSLVLGVATSVLWACSAAALGRGYERRRLEAYSRPYPGETSAH